MTFGSGSNGCLGHGNFNDVAQVGAWEGPCRGRGLVVGGAWVMGGALLWEGPCHVRGLIVGGAMGGARWPWDSRAHFRTLSHAAQDRGGLAGL